MWYITGLAGNTLADKARADMIVDITNDLLPQLVAVYKEQDASKKVIHLFNKEQKTYLAGIK